MERVSVASVHSPDLMPMTPEEGGWVPLEGDAQARLRTLRDTATIWSGIATLEPCSFSYTAEHPGAIHILEGEASISFGDTTRDLEPGAIVYLETGTTTTWIVKTPLKEFFVAAVG